MPSGSAGAVRDLGRMPDPRRSPGWRIDTQFVDLEAQGAIHRPGLEVGHVQRHRQSSGHRALAHPRGAVDCHDNGVDRSSPCAAGLTLPALAFGRLSGLPVLKDSTSWALSSLYEPTGSSRSDTLPIPTRIRRWTGLPMRKNISRICRLRPSCSSTTHQEFDSPLPPRGPLSNRIFAGVVRLPSNRMPAFSLAMDSSAGTPLTLAW